MSALGQLPSNVPLPVGSVGRKTGVYGAGRYWPYPGNWFDDGGGGAMLLYFTPTRRCWLVVHGHLIVASSSAGWNRCDVGLVSSPYDLTGRNVGARVAMSSVAGVPWEGVSLSATFYIEANQTFAVGLYSFIWDGQGGMQYHDGAAYLTLFGYTLGEGYIG